MTIQSWNELSEKVAIIFGSVGIVTAILYLIRLSIISDSKAKYDFINQNEVKIIWISCLLIIFAICVYFNSHLVSFITQLEIFVRLFVSLAMGLIVAVFIRTLLNYYYPFYMEKRLKVLRTKPRISLKTGKPMRLLTEEEEDVHLDEGMQAEENVFSVDYDVWIDDETQYKKIEKYSGHLHATPCPECNYQTLKLEREEIVQQPTETIEGKVVKHYKCTYCGYKARKDSALKLQTKTS